MREMKDSGIKWVNKIPVGWKVARLKDVIQMLTDYTANGSFGDLAKNVQYLDYEDYARLIRLTDLRENLENSGVYVSEYSYDYLAKSSLYGGEILVANVGAYAGLFCEMPPINMPSTLGPNMFLIRTNPKMLQHYLYYLGNADFVWKQLVQKAMSSAQPKLNKTDVKTTYIIIPPVQEQKRIANFLDAKCAEIDSLTADIQTQIDTLEQYKRSVITEAVTKGLNPDVEMKDSGTPWCPLIPIHWKYANPKALFTQRLDRAYPGDKQLTASQEYGVIYQDEYMELTGTKIVTVMKDFSILKHVEPNDFVISMRSFQGGLEYSERRGSISSAYVMLIPNNEYVYPPFYRWFFKSSKYINAIQSTSNLVRDGQAMRYANFAQVPLFIIPLDEQKQISEYLDEKVRKIDEILKSKKSQLEILAEYKKSLIYEYVTGKKEVPSI